MTALSFEISLEVAVGPKLGALVSVKRLPFVIGRATECHLRPTSEAVAHRQCVLAGRGERLSLEHLGGEAETLPDGEVPSGRAEVGDGHEIAIGPLRFVPRVVSVPTRRS